MAKNEQLAAAKEGAERVRLLALRKNIVIKYKNKCSAEEDYQGVSAEDVFVWELEEMNLVNLRDIYRACTVSNTSVADFNGVLKSVAQTVNKEECINYTLQVVMEDVADDGEGGEEEVAQMEMENQVENDNDEQMDIV